MSARKALHFRLFLPVLDVFLVGRIHLVVHTKHPYISAETSLTSEEINK